MSGTQQIDHEHRQQWLSIALAFGLAQRKNAEGKVRRTATFGEQRYLP